MALPGASHCLFDFILTLILPRAEERLQTILTSVINGEDEAGGQVYHEVDLLHQAAGQKIEKKFGVLNLVAKSSLVHSEKYFPWVAVAAPLTVSFSFILTIKAHYC